MVSPMPELCRTHALPRVGLLGNPSDGYGGRVISFTFSDFRATVEMNSSQVSTIGAYENAAAIAAADIAHRLEDGNDDGGTRLLLAATKRFCSETDLEVRGFSMTCSSTIPRQVGLAGSSAIIIAALRGLMAWHEVSIATARIAELALRAETEDLGIAAGPQDRVIQSFEGLVDMDFGADGPAEPYVPMAPHLLPPLFVAWDPTAAESSDVAHNDIKGRYERGEAAVVHAMKTFPQLAARGRVALEEHDAATFRDLVNENFDLRASIWNLRARDIEMVELARHHGAACKFTGSGGAVVGVMPHEEDYSAIASAFKDASFNIIRPTIDKTRTDLA